MAQCARMHHEFGDLCQTEDGATLCEDCVARHGCHFCGALECPTCVGDPHHDYLGNVGLDIRKCGACGRQACGDSGCSTTCAICERTECRECCEGMDCKMCATCEQYEEEMAANGPHIPPMAYPNTSVCARCYAFDCAVGNDGCKNAAALSRLRSARLLRNLRDFTSARA